jgi:nucleoside-diphosphate-sugar epimerase
MKLRVAVIGATGFLGSHIAARWAIRQDTTVVGVIRREGDTLPPGVEAVCADLGDWRTLSGPLDATDVVISASAPGIPGELIVAACAHAGIHRLIHISSLAVFGIPPGGRVGDDVALYPTSKYGRIKLTEENVIRVAAAEVGISLVVLRVPAVFGPRMKGPPLRLARWVQKSRPIPSAGGRRSLMYVENVAAATESAAMMPSRGCEAYVIEDGYCATPLEFARHVAAALGQKLPRVMAIPDPVVRLGAAVMGAFPAVSVDVTRWLQDIVADGTRFRATSGFHPPIDQPEAMMRTAEWLLTRSRVGTGVR